MIMIWPGNIESGKPLDFASFSESTQSQAVSPSVGKANYVIENGIFLPTPEQSLATKPISHRTSPYHSTLDFIQEIHLNSIIISSTTTKNHLHEFSIRNLERWGEWRIGIVDGMEFIYFFQLFIDRGVSIGCVSVWGVNINHLVFSQKITYCLDTCPNISII